MTVTGWSAAEIDGMEIADLTDWLEEAGEHARATNEAIREARERASRSS